MSPNIAPMVTPKELAAKSIHSPLRVVVAYSCSNSSKPLIRTGASQARRKSLPPAQGLGVFAVPSFPSLGRVCALRYSIHSTPHVPPYITKCVHLSINATSSKPVSGKNGISDKTHISMKHVMEKGYILTN